MTAPTPPETALEYAERSTEEYSVVALVPIEIYGGRAANPGDPIPASHVERGLVLPDQVAKPSTKPGREALRAIGLNYPEPPESESSASTPTRNAEKQKG